jgi:hypothetical protein
VTAARRCSRAVDPSLSHIVAKMLPLAECVVRCSHNITRRGSPESGLTSQAMAAAARTYMQEHMHVVLQLEDRACAASSRLSLLVGPSQCLPFHSHNVFTLRVGLCVFPTLPCHPGRCHSADLAQSASVTLPLSLLCFPQEMWFSVQSSLTTLGTLDAIMSAAPNATGGMLLNALHKCVPRCGCCRC